MKIVLTPFGSRGDVQPMLALGLGLKARGHEVTVATSPNYRSWIEGHGLRFHPVGGDVESWLRMQAGAQNVVAFLRSLARFLRDDVPCSFIQTREAVRGADLVVTTIHLAAHSAAKVEGVPCRTILYTTQLVPSCRYPPLAVPWQGLPTWMNRLLWWVAEKGFDLLFRSPVNNERRRWGLDPIRSFLPHARGLSPLVASDAVFAPLPDDAPQDMVQTGALMMPANDPLDERVEAFLSAGDPPVYVGFGSMPDRDPIATAKMITEAVHALHTRVLISAGWAELSGVEQSHDVLCVHEVPHANLLPRVAVAVHHGGAGTIAACLRAGVPQVVVPHNADQFFHAKRVFDLGLGPAPISRSRLTANRLVLVLRAVLSDNSFAERARAVATTLAGTDGVGTAIEVLTNGTTDRRHPLPAPRPPC